MIRNKHLTPLLFFLMVIILLSFPNVSATVYTFDFSIESNTTISPPAYSWSYFDGYKVAGYNSIYMFAGRGLATDFTTSNSESFINLEDSITDSENITQIRFYIDNSSTSNDRIIFPLSTGDNGLGYGSTPQISNGWNTASITGDINYGSYKNYYCISTTCGLFRVTQSGANPSPLSIGIIEITTDGIIPETNSITTDKSNYSYLEYVNVSYNLLNDYQGGYIYLFADNEPISSINGLSSGSGTTRFYLNYLDYDTLTNMSVRLYGKSYYDLYNYNSVFLDDANFTYNSSNISIPYPEETENPIPGDIPDIIDNGTGQDISTGQSGLGGNVTRINNGTGTMLQWGTNAMNNMSNSLNNVSGYLSNVSLANYSNSSLTFIPSTLSIIPIELWMIIILGWIGAFITIIVRG